MAPPTGLALSQAAANLKAMPGLPRTSCCTELASFARAKCQCNQCVGGKGVHVLLASGNGTAHVR